MYYSHPINGFKGKKQTKRLNFWEGVDFHKLVDIFLINLTAERTLLMLVNNKLFLENINFTSNVIRKLRFPVVLIDIYRRNMT